MLKLVHYAMSYVQLIDLRDDKKGASLAEYALLLGLITGAVVLTVTLLSGAISDVITGTTELIGPADAGADPAP